MALEEVKRIKLAEDEVAEKLARAKARGKEITDSAAADAEKAYEAALDNAVKLGRARVAEESEKAEEKAQALFEENKKLCKEIEDKSRGNLAKAAEFIIAETLK